MRYLDLMAGTKPHLLTELTNGIGLRTTIEYAPSTAFAAADAAAGEPWLTTLPFPVHVVHRTITADEVTGTVLTSRFAYHDGCYDGVERELRGFAMVERFDTELLATLDRLGATNAAAATAVPPTLTRSWFHTGVLADADTLERRYAGGAGSRSYYREPADRIDPAPALAALLPDTVVPDGLTAEEARQAVRAHCAPRRCVRRSTASTACPSTRTSSPSTPTASCACSTPMASPPPCSTATCARRSPPRTTAARPTRASPTS